MFIIPAPDPCSDAADDTTYDESLGHRRSRRVLTVLVEALGASAGLPPAYRPPTRTRV